MKIRSIFYHLKQGFKNIYRNRLFSLASIATITACVFLFGVFYSIMMNFEYMVKKAENEVCVTVFFDEGLSDTEIKKLGDTISNRVEVSSVHYTSAEEAWNNFKSEYFAAYPDLAEGFKDNPLINSASYEVYLSDAGMQGTLVTYLENLDGVRQVNRSEATASGLSSAAKLVGYVAIAVIIILLAVSIFLITNTIVIGITVRKEEISIMKFIGATDAFVNAPFFVEGIAIGIIVAGMMAVDMGGPFNKAAYVFGTASIAAGNYGIMAAVMIGGMVPPCAIALASLLFKDKFTKTERESAPTNFIMGLAFITEGAIPFAASDPLHVIPACVIGSGLAGALSMAFNCTLMAPHGGIFVFPVVGNPLMYLAALAVGTVVGALMLGVLKKKIAE